MIAPLDDHDGMTVDEATDGYIADGVAPDLARTLATYLIEGPPPGFIVD